MILSFSMGRTVVGLRTVWGVFWVTMVKLYRRSLLIARQCAWDAFESSGGGCSSGTRERGGSYEQRYQEA